MSTAVATGQASPWDELQRCKPLVTEIGFATASRTALRLFMCLDLNPLHDDIGALVASELSYTGSELYSRFYTWPRCTELRQTIKEVSKDFGFPHLILSLYIGIGGFLHI